MADDQSQTDNPLAANPDPIEDTQPGVEISVDQTDEAPTKEDAHPHYQETHRNVGIQESCGAFIARTVVLMIVQVLVVIMFGTVFTVRSHSVLTSRG